MDFTFKVLSVNAGSMVIPENCPQSVSWLVWHSFSNVGTSEQARSLEEISCLANWASGLALNQAMFMRENAFSCVEPDGGIHVYVIPPHEQRDRFLDGMRASGTIVRPATDEEFNHHPTPLAEMLYKCLIQTFKSAAEAHLAIDPYIDKSMMPFELRELFFCLALRELDLCLQNCLDGNVAGVAFDHYAQAAAASAMGGGSFNWGVAFDNSSEMAARRASKSRWSRLDSVKEFAFKRRAELSSLSRSAAIDRILPDILTRCREAGEPLSGAVPKDTVTRWFREAGIK